MSDLISRQDAVEVAKAVCAVTGDVNVAKVCDQLMHLPSVQQWIPCSERLPEPNEMVLISVNGEVDADWIAVDNTGYGCWYRTMRHAIDIDAWMPLPEPQGD